MGNTISLGFPLNVEDDWPPVSLESLPFSQTAEGFALQVPPLFVKGLSVGDIIAVEKDEENRVWNWSHLQKSKHTTVWILRIKAGESIAQWLEELRTLGCRISDFGKYGCYALDVPEHIPIETIDQRLEQLDPEHYATAFPSMRHEEG